VTERDDDTTSDFAARGSQRWLQLAVNQRPELVNEPLRRVMGLGLDETITWVSPLAADACREYRDGDALRRVGIGELSTRPIKDFWPQRGPVWDGLARTASGRSVFVEAKAHIAEAASPGTRAGDSSRGLIVASLEEARRFYAPRATSEWSGTFFQYGNRLAHHYLLRVANGLPCALVFCYFINATDVGGPSSAIEWRGAIKLLHAVLGLPSDLEQHGIYDVFVDVRDLS
jgi:hypothetical protein